jgi:N-acetylmuramoyl-L-alanine amidase
VLAAQRDLARIGYDTRPSGRLDTTTASVIAAFQRHWRPANCDGGLDPETARRIALRAKAAAAPSI